MDTFGAGFLLWFSIAVSTILLVAAASPALILTPYIKKNQTEAARNLSTVDETKFLNVTSHSGFITVDESYNSNLFFWYFPVSDKKVNETPWIIWLQGGPGASSLAGLFDEIGPFKYDGELKLRQESWGKSHSLLFIDNPVGAGYSFTDDTRGFIQNMDKCSEHLYNFLQQFVTLFPELSKAPLYIAGESYAGRYVPAFAYKILQSQRDITINLQGLMMGNPVFNHKDIANYTQLYYQWGLIDSQGVLAAKSLQDAYMKAINENKYAEAYDLRYELMSKLEDIAMQQQSFNVLKDKIDVQRFVPFITRQDIQEAIHVGKIAFTFSNGTVHSNLKSDFLRNNTREITTLLEHNRILIYCGQLDLTAPCVPNAEARRRSWFWNNREEFLNAPRKPWWNNDSVAGYFKSGGRLTEVLVRGAGHLVPIDKPLETQQLISYFIRDFDLPVPQNYVVLPTDIMAYQPESIINDKTIPYYYGKNAGLIVSVIINAILILFIVGCVVYYLRFKRRNAPYFYDVADDDSSISDGILTMT
ncbi:venom serine carboxypeptidase [Aphomia sociella]